MADKLTPEQAAHLRRTFAGWVAIESFLTDLEISNRAARTIVEYRKTLQLYMLETGDFSLDVSPDTLRRWIRMQKDRGCKPRTLAGRMTVLSGFFDFAVNEGLMTKNPVKALPRIKTPEVLPRALTQDETRLLFAAIDAREGEVGRRDQLLFRLMYLVGLRVSEAVSLRVEDINLDTRSIRVWGKGSKERVVYMKADLADQIRVWLGADGPRGGEWLFPGMEEGSHLKSRVAQLYMAEYRRAAGFKKKVTCHTLRHSHATHAVLAGAPITHIQKELGHASVKTTTIYTQLVDADRKRITDEIELAI
ncbi:MAG: tyrosine-type recombinase/integrase [Polyangiaceae bacterium]|nr:tyrosine-type recombinase/integrase [Polyangiaceae bacterium]